VAQVVEVCFLHIAQLVHQWQWNSFFLKQLAASATKLLELARLMPGYNEQDLKAIKCVTIGLWEEPPMHHEWQFYFAPQERAYANNKVDLLQANGATLPQHRPHVISCQQE